MPKRKFVRDMVLVILAAKSVQLASISRSLQEPIDLKKTQERLSRNLSSLSNADYTQGGFTAEIEGPVKFCIMNHNEHFLPLWFIAGGPLRWSRFQDHLKDTAFTGAGDIESSLPVCQGQNFSDYTSGTDFVLIDPFDDRRETIGT